MRGLEEWKVLRFTAYGVPGERGIEITAPGDIW